MGRGLTTGQITDGRITSRAHHWCHFVGGFRPLYRTWSLQVSSVARSLFLDYPRCREDG